MKRLVLLLAALLLLPMQARAALTFHIAGTEGSWSNSATDVVTMPSASSGDICVAALGHYNSSGSLSTSPPSGWTFRYSSSLSGGRSVWFFTHQSNGSDSGSVTFTPATGGDYGGGQIICFSGANTTTPVDSATTTTNSCYTGATNGCDVPGATLSQNGDGVVAIAITAGNQACSATNTFDTPSGYTATTSCGGGGIAGGVQYGWTSVWYQVFSATTTLPLFHSSWVAAGFDFAEGVIAIQPGAATATHVDVGSSIGRGGPITGGITVIH